MFISKQQQQTQLRLAHRPLELEATLYNGGKVPCVAFVSPKVGQACICDFHSLRNATLQTSWRHWCSQERLAPNPAILVSGPKRMGGSNIPKIRIRVLTCRTA